MGSTNHGTQTITFGYYTSAAQTVWAKLNKDITPTGIYTGGYLTRTSDSEISLSVFTAVLEDSNHNVKISTESAISITSDVLDSGSLTSAYPWIALRWSYLASVSNFMEVVSLSSLSSAQSNDIIVGKVNWSGSTITGFDYSDRSDPEEQKIILKVEATESTELYVRVRKGKINNGTAYYSIANQKVGPFTAPSTNSRIDLVYVNLSTGALSIAQGTESASPTAPAYAGKMVLAQVTLGVGSTDITSSMITDVRPAVSVPSQVDNDSLQYNSSGQIEIKNPFYSNVVYDSGWFSAVTQTDYIKTHNLNSTTLIAQLMFAPDDGAGSPDLTKVTPMASQIDVNDDKYAFATASLKKLTSTTISIYGGWSKVGAVPDLSGTYDAVTYSSGWLRVILLKVA